MVEFLVSISCGVPIYYTWVERDKNSLWTNALSKGIHTERESNPQPSDYESIVSSQ